MAPAKKAAAPAKSLSEMLGNDKNEEVTTPVDEPVVVDKPNDVDVEGNDRVETNILPDPMAGKTEPYVGDDGQVSTIPVWQENPEHNLGKVHPDVLPQPDPVHQAQTSKVVHVTQFAGVNVNDDKGFPEQDPDEEQLDESSTSEFAPENKNDDKNLKRDEDE